MWKGSHWKNGSGQCYRDQICQTRDSLRNAVSCFSDQDQEFRGARRNPKLKTGRWTFVSDRCYSIIEEVTRIQETGVVRSERRVEFMLSIYMIMLLGGNISLGRCTYHNIRIFTFNGHSKLDFHNKKKYKNVTGGRGRYLKVQRTSIIP